MALSLTGAASGAAAGSSFGPWGTAIGAIAGGLFGKQKAPKAVAPPQVDIGKAVSDSLSINSANFDSAAKLSKRTNDFNQGEATRLLDQAIPGFSALQSRLVSKINEDLNSNGLPADVSSRLQRLAAERGISRGTSGNFNEFSLVKDFGFNLVDYENAKRARALSTLSTVYNMAPRINPMTPMASFVTPGQALDGQRFNEMGRYAEQSRQAGDGAAADNYNTSLWSGAANIVAQVASGWAAGKVADKKTSSGGGQPS